MWIWFFGMVKFVQHFFDHESLDPEINQTHICFIPKIDSPTQVKDYRPISLCNVAYKIISKILADRLKPWLTFIISKYQSAFIPGMLITDNILIAHEILHSLQTKKIKHAYMALKLDIAKAFDKVEWNFIEAMMRKLGFADKWCKWVMACVKSVTYSVLIYGSPVGKIAPTRGIRQGDPISPYLYLICTEGLSALIKRFMQQKKIHGFKASRNGPSISHMFFADDSLIFCKTNDQECRNLLEILSIYGRALGQRVNFRSRLLLFLRAQILELR